MTRTVRTVLQSALETAEQSLPHYKWERNKLVDDLAAAERRLTQIGEQVEELKAALSEDDN